jgi:hypothetical protein
MMPGIVFFCMAMAAAIVWIIHCNVEYWSLPREERQKLDDEMRWW